MDVNQSRGCVATLAAVFGVGSAFGVAMWQIEHSDTPEWLPYAAGGAILCAILLLMPKRPGSLPLWANALKLLCYLLCIPLGFLPLVAILWLVSLTGLKNLPDWVATAGAGLSLVLAVAISRILDATLFRKWFPHQIPNDRNG